MRSSRPWWCSPARTIRPAPNCCWRSQRILEHCQSAQVAGAHDGVHPIVVVDEAYIEFRNPGTPSATTLINDYDNLAVSRTIKQS